jgi:sporadic carbohydrate cluster protein (TIGR04323 family)
MKKFRGYIFSRKFGDERAPQSVQNIVVRDYCLSRGFEFLLSKPEYALKNSYKVLFYAMNELRHIDGMIFYSLFMLPENKKTRYEIYDKFFLLNKTLIFALENLEIKNREELNTIEEILNIKRIMDNKKFSQLVEI